MHIFYFVCACAFIYAHATAGSYVVHERRAASRHEWLKRSIVQPELTLPMRIALAQEGLDTAVDTLMSLSDSTSPHFSRYWSATEVARKFAPSKETVEGVVGWLNRSGIAPERLTRSRSAGWVYFDATAQEVENLLKTKYHLYERSETGDIQAACDEYSVPATIQKYIDFITPTVHLGKALGRRGNNDPAPNSRRLVHSKEIEDIKEAFRISSKMSPQKDIATATPTKCAEFMTLDCLRSMYNIPIGNTSQPNNSFGIVQFAYVSWLPTDLDAFFSVFMRPLIGHRPLMERIDGGYWQDRLKGFPFNGEADLDMQYAMSLVFPLDVTNYQVGDLFLSGTRNNLLAALDKTYCGALDPHIDPIYPDPRPGGYNSSDCGTLKPANVISISYADNEADYPPAYARRECLEYLKLGLQGVTVIVSTADYGVAGQANTCLSSPGNHTNSSSPANRFNPTFPAACPYVTSVGGTQLPANSSSVCTPEVAFYQNFNTSISSSGGGFSNVFPVPAYQAHVTRRYLMAQHDRLANISASFNAAGRGFPDVAANAANYVTAIDGSFHTVFGTSASAPVFASVIAKINDARLRVGKRPVGFLNPVLYRHQHVMNDIKSGFNLGCGGRAFVAGEGWDPVTGLGTPDYKRLLDLYLKLP
jgi:tripeptidyl-peptidase I